MFPRWVQPSAPGARGRELRLEEPLLRGPARDGLGLILMMMGKGKPVSSMGFWSISMAGEGTKSGNGITKP